MVSSAIWLASEIFSLTISASLIRIDHISAAKINTNGEMLHPCLTPLLIVKWGEVPWENATELVISL